MTYVISSSHHRSFSGPHIAQYSLLLNVTYLCMMLIIINSLFIYFAWKDYDFSEMNKDRKNCHPESIVVANLLRNSRTTNKKNMIHVGLLDLLLYKFQRFPFVPNKKCMWVSIDRIRPKCRFFIDDRWSFLYF